jgi:hypothetical protein
MRCASHGSSYCRLPDLTRCEHPHYAFQTVVSGRNPFSNSYLGKQNRSGPGIAFSLYRYSHADGPDRSQCVGDLL